LADPLPRWTESWGFFRDSASVLYGRLTGANGDGGKRNLRRRWLRVKRSAPRTGRTIVGDGTTTWLAEYALRNLYLDSKVLSVGNRRGVLCIDAPLAGGPYPRLAGDLCCTSLSPTERLSNTLVTFDRSTLPRDRPGLAKATLAAEVDGVWWGQRAAAGRRPSRLRLITVRIASPGSAASFVCAYHGPAVMRTVRRRAIGLRPDGGRRFLLRFSDGARALGGRLSEDRGRDARIVKEDEHSSESRWIARSGRVLRDLNQSLRWSTFRMGWPKSRPFRSIVKASLSICARPARAQPGRSVR